MPDPVLNNKKFVDLLNNKLQDNTTTTVRIVGTSDSPLIVQGHVDLRGAIFTKPVQFEHVVFQGFVDLSDIRAERSLRLEDCTFEDSLKLADTKVDGLLSLKRSVLKCNGRMWFDFRRLKVSGLFDATLLFADGCLDMANFRGESDVWFHSVRIYAYRKHKNQKEQSVYDLRDVEQATKKWSEPTDQSNTDYLFGKAIHLTGANIEQNVFFQNEGGNPVYIDGQIDLRARIGRQVNFAMAHIYSTPTGYAIDLEKAVIGASVFFRKTFVLGQIDLRSRVGGQISIRESIVKTHRSLVSIRMENADIKGSVVIDEKTKILGKLELKCKIERNLEISNSKIFTGKNRTSVDLTSATVYGNIKLSMQTVLKGQLDLRGTVRGNVILDHLKIIVDNKTKAIDAEAAKIHGSLFIESSTFQNQVDLRATIHGDVRVERTRIFTEPLPQDAKQIEPDDDRGLSLDLRMAEIGGSVMMRACNKFHGRVAIMGRIAGDVIILKSRVITRANQFALSLNRAHIEGSVYIGDKTRIIGCLDMRCRVKNDVSLSQVSILSHRSGTAVDLQAAHIGGTLYLDHGTRICGRIDCSQANIEGAFDIRPDTPAWPRCTSHDQPPDEPPKIGDPLALTLIGDLILDYTDICGPLYIHRLDCHGRFSARHLTVQGDLQLCQSFLRGGFNPTPTPTARRFLYTRFNESNLWSSSQIDSIGSMDSSQAPSTTVFNLELSDIHGQIHIFGTVFAGSVTLEDADIHGEANFANSVLYGDLMMRSTSVDGRVFIDEERRHGSKCYPQVRGVLDVSYAKLKQVDIKVDFDSPTSSPQLIVLSGAEIDSFTYDGPIPNEECSNQEKMAYPLLVTEAVTIKTLHITNAAVAKTPEYKQRTIGSTGRDITRVVTWALLCIWVAILVVLNWNTVFATVFCGYVVIVCAIIANNRNHSVPLLDHLHMTYPFSRGYYLLVERLQRSIGDDATADEIFHMRRVRENSRPKVIPASETQRLTMIKDRKLEELDIRPRTSIQRCWQYLLRVGMGYGIRTGRLLHIYIFLFFLNTAVFLNPRSVERPTTFVQNRSDATLFDLRKLKDEQDQIKTNADNPWPSEGFLPDIDKDTGRHKWDLWNAGFMALRVQIPALQLVAENDWTPATRRIQVLSFELCSFADYASVMMILNIILIPLIIAGLTGYIKKRQSMA